jgi:glycosyltransferase involved in cell wall biosynthesis
MIALVGYLFGDGGIQSHTRQLAMGLAARGHRVVVFTPSAFDVPTHAVDDQPYEVVIYPKGWRGLWQLTRQLQRRRPEVIVVTGYGWNAMIAAIACRSIRRRVFFEVMSGDRGSRRDPRVLVRAGFQHLVGQAAPVTERFVQSFGYRGPSTTIPALSDPLESTGAVARAVAHRVPMGTARGAYFGRLISYKNPLWLVQQWKQLAPAIGSLDIHGTGPEADAITQAIAEHNLGDRIRLHGRYPAGADYARLLQQYDLVLLPTVGWEGAPLVLLESMCCGVPFVANGMGGIPDYTNPDCRITSGDIQEFLPAVTSIALSLDQCHIDHARLQHHYHTHFSNQRLIDRWESLLRNTQ